MEFKGKELTEESIQKLWDFWFDRCTSICECCEHYIPKYFKCSPSTCEYYEEFKDAPKVPSYTSNSYRALNCQDLDFANCKALEGTVCKECNNNNLSHFSWNGRIVINKYD